MLCIKLDNFMSSKVQYFVNSLVNKTSYKTDFEYFLIGLILALNHGTVINECFIQKRSPLAD